MLICVPIYVFGRVYQKNGGVGLLDGAYTRRSEVSQRICVRGVGEVAHPKSAANNIVSCWLYDVAMSSIANLIVNMHNDLAKKKCYFNLFTHELY